jgi:hypothetical protein
MTALWVVAMMLKFQSHSRADNDLVLDSQEKKRTGINS